MSRAPQQPLSTILYENFVGTPSLYLASAKSFPSYVYSTCRTAITAFDAYRVVSSLPTLGQCTAYLHDGIFEKPQEGAEQKQKDVNWLGSAADITQSALTGYIVRGDVEGAATAACATIADEMLMHHAGTKKHFLTSTTLWTYLGADYLARAYPDYAASIYTGAAVAGAIIAFSSRDSLDNKEQVTLLFGSLPPVLDLFDEYKVAQKVYRALILKPLADEKITFRDFDYLLGNKVITNIATKFAIDFVNANIDNLFVKYIAENGTSMLALSLMQAHPTESVFNLAKKAIYISAFWSVKTIVISCLNSCKSCSDVDLKNSIEQFAIEDILLNPKNFQKILGLDDPTIPQTIGTDLNDALTNASFGFSKLTTSKFQSFLNLQNLVSVAPESLVVFKFASMLKTYIEKLRADVQQEASKNSVSWQDQEVKTDLSSNFLIAAATKAIDYFRAKYSSLVEKEAANLSSQESTKQVAEYYTQGLEILKSLTDILYFSYKFSVGEVKLEQLALLQGWISSASQFLEGNNAVTFSSGTRSFSIYNNFKIGNKTPEEIIERLKKLFEVLNKEYKSDVNRFYNEDGNLVVEDYKLFLKEKQIVGIDSLVLERGQCYAISGVNGQGKSTFFKDLTGFLTKPMKSEGRFSFPKIDGEEVEPLMVDQKVFIPQGSTLLEAILLKFVAKMEESEKANALAKVTDLFREMAIESLIPNLDDNSFNTSSLSDGQRAMVGIIRAIMAKPALLLLDESFGRMDAGHIMKAQKMIKNYLADSIVIIIDHHTKMTNHNGFYHKVFKFGTTGHGCTTDNKTSSAIPKDLTMLMPEVTDEAEGDNTIQETIALRFCLFTDSDEDSATVTEPDRLATEEHALIGSLTIHEEI